MGTCFVGAVLSQKVHLTWSSPETLGLSTSLSPQQPAASRGWSQRVGLWGRAGGSRGWRVIGAAPDRPEGDGRKHVISDIAGCDARAGRAHPARAREAAAASGQRGCAGSDVTAGVTAQGGGQSGEHPSPSEPLVSAEREAGSGGQAAGPPQEGRGPAQPLRNHWHLPRSAGSLILAQEPPYSAPSPAQRCSGLRCEGGRGLLRQRSGGVERPGLGGQASTGSDLPRGERGEVWGRLPPASATAWLWCSRAGLRLSLSAQVATLWLKLMSHPRPRPSGSRGARDVGATT